MYILVHLADDLMCAYHVPAARRARWIGVPRGSLTYVVIQRETGRCAAGVKRGKWLGNGGAISNGLPRLALSGGTKGEMGPISCWRVPI